MSDRYAAIRAHATRFDVRMMCAALEVSPSGYYDAVAREYGAAPKAFLVVPLVCGFVIDLVNALVIGLLAR